MANQERGAAIGTENRIAYKVLTADEASRMRHEGRFHGSPVDLADGFIHMSTASQLPVTIKRHFAGQAGLMIAAVDLVRLGHAVRWESSRGGELFPHFYGVLPLAAVVAWGAVERTGDAELKLPA